jgi:hypothetical protein
MTEEHEALERRFAAASTRINRGLTMQSGAGRDEGVYAAIYQELVRAGLRPQIRKRYRR